MSLRCLFFWSFESFSFSLGLEVKVGGDEMLASDGYLSSELNEPRESENRFEQIVSVDESSRELEKFGNPHLVHSHTQDEFARASYVETFMFMHRMWYQMLQESH